MHNGDVDRPVARPVELAEEDALPRAQRERPVLAQRHDHARPHQRGANMPRRVLLVRLDVLPRPVVADDALERDLVIAGDRGIGVLVDGDACGRVRHVYDDRGPARALDRRAHVARDVHELASPLRPQPDLAHQRGRGKPRPYKAPPATGGAPASSGLSPFEARARYSSTWSRLSRPRSTTASSSVIEATSSRCSCRNQCRNCSPTSSPSSRASFTSSTIWSVTRFSCPSASATGATASEKSVCGASTPGIRTLESESRRYCTIIIAWFRSSRACR